MLAQFLSVEIQASVASNQCQIGIKTISSWVHDGKEIGIHGGWASHPKNVAPLREAETNVLVRIASQLHSMRKGDPTPLPPTPDTKDAVEYPIKQLMELNPETKTNLLPLIGTMTNTNKAPVAKQNPQQ